MPPSTKFLYKNQIKFEIVQSLKEYIEQNNPNIFQICTLKHSNSEISKRQEIGRGLRICVNNDGDRMDYKVLDENFFNIIIFHIFCIFRIT